MSESPMPPTGRQHALIAHLATQLEFTPEQVEQITESRYGQPIAWPLNRKSASMLITELQLVRQDRREAQP